MDSMERLRAFQAVAKETSFSKAANRIYRTQPAVSQAVKALELELGERLFLRRGRVIALTQAGRILLEDFGAGLHLSRPGQKENFGP